MFERVAGNVGGRIRDKRGDLGWENAALGYPVTDELTTPDGKGKYNHFQNGSIYYSPAGGCALLAERFVTFGPKPAGRKAPSDSRHRTRTPPAAEQNFIGGAIQAFEPTGVALEKFDNKAYSSYRQVYPLFAKEDLPRWHAAGAHRELIQNMDKYFPLTGCPKEITQGAVCTLTGVGGRSGKVTVDRILDTGFTLKTAADHPEGAGRLLTIRFDEVTAPPKDEKNLVFDTADIKTRYTGSNKTWIRLIVESSGPTASTQVQGPFSSEHIGT